MAAAPAAGNSDSHGLWKDLLRDIYHSEDLKIKSERSERIRNTIHRLCTETIEGDDLDSFVVSFKKVEDNIRVIKDACKQKKQTLFQQMFQYQANSLSSITQYLPTNLKDPILWQVSRVGVVTVLLKAMYYICYFQQWRIVAKGGPDME